MSQPAAPGLYLVGFTAAGAFATGALVPVAAPLPTWAACAAGYNEIMYRRHLGANGESLTNKNKHVRADQYEVHRRRDKKTS